MAAWSSLTPLEDENAKVKRLLADQMLGNIVLKDLLGKNRRHKRNDETLHSGPCGIMTSRSVGRANSLASTIRLVGAIVHLTNPKIRKEMKKIANKRRRFGYRRIVIMLEREGYLMHHKKLYHFYTEENWASGDDVARGITPTNATCADAR